MAADEPVVEQKIVTAVGTATRSRTDLGRRIEKAMADEILRCGEEGISTEEKNSVLLRERMQAARRRVLSGEE